MDFIYSQLPEVVEDMIYQPLEGDGTVKISVNNTNKTIEANVLKTPGSLNINILDLDVKGGEDQIIKNSIGFDGSIDKSIDIKLPKYKILNTTGKNREDVRGRYQLFEYNYINGAYEAVPGDDIVFEQQLDELNIENGLGTSAISGIDAILENDRIIDGAYAKGIQSVAFGGDSLELINGKKPLQIIELEGDIYYILNTNPLTLKLDPKTNINSGETIDKVNEGDGNKINIKGIDYSYKKLEDGSYKFSVVKRTGAIIVKSVKFTSAEANGDQSFAMGQNVKANSPQSQAFGIGTIASYPGQMVIGTYNTPVENALFIIGNGTNEFNRSNALVVYADGTTISSKQIKVEDTTPDDNYNENEVVTMEVLDNYQFDDGVLYQ